MRQSVPDAFFICFFCYSGLSIKPNEVLFRLNKLISSNKSELNNNGTKANFNLRNLISEYFRQIFRCNN